ncbi:hypothetical protein GCM10009530_33280 [Microbispora corallina]|uniref:Uncharacterized protein n=1 Tax=Microbispora corallina TaxID=83302 RepID=A0ABQ4G209_9ACTN|nr:hypothetical protein Mco01_40970 [Microbispora corallina]
MESQGSPGRRGFGGGADGEGEPVAPGEREGALGEGEGIFDARAEGSATTIVSPGPGVALTDFAASGFPEALLQAHATTATTTSMPVSTDTRRRQ